MQIKLNYLEIENFKGIKHFRLDLGGESAIIQGKNGTGKTTIADAFYWLMTDQDSNLQTKFNALELDNTGITIDQQDATVTAEIFVGSKSIRSIRLTKSYRQKWTIKRGHAQAEMTGHTTEYFFDRVPVSRKKYLEGIAGLVDPELFRLLSDPIHFCGRMKPEARRTILIDLAGRIDDDAIIAADASLATLPDILGDHTPDEAKAILLADRKKADEQLKQLPNRIDELQKMKPDLAGLNEAELQEKVKGLNEQIQDKKREILAINSGLSIDEARKQLAFAETELVIAERKIRDEMNAQLDNLISSKRQANDAWEGIISELEKVQKRIASIDVELQENADNRAELLDEWKRINAGKINLESTCYACGQALSQDQLAGQVEKFNANKAEKLRRINDSGHALRQLADNMTREKDRAQALFMQFSDQSEKQKTVMQSIDADIKTYQNKIETTIGEQTAKLREQIAAAREQIQKSMSDIGPEIEACEEALSGFEMEKGRAESKLLDFTQLEKIERRIAERRQDLKEAAAAYEDIERQLYILELYSRKRSEYIEENVSQQFQITKWKLFEMQINGGIREVCEPTYQGVPYSSDLNTGAKINIGLDCIKTLSAHYGASLPVFIDNAESITDWQVDLEQQTIRLVAMPNKKELEVILNGN